VSFRSASVAAALCVLLPSCTPATSAPARLPGGGLSDRGGIEGAAISLEHPDSELRDYLGSIRTMIRSNWVYPCVRDDVTPACEFKSATLSVEFGILKNGVLQFVELRQSAGAGLEIYDHHALEAIKRSSPFPVMPQDVVAALKPGSTGLPIVATFNYVVAFPRVLPLTEPGQRQGR
jgi:hypothetical protein